MAPKVVSPPGALAPPPIDPSSPPTQGDARLLGLKVLLGGLANSIASIATNPADVVKTRQQLAARSTASLPTNFVAVTRSMITHEGPLSLWKGLSGSVLREMTYSGIRMGCFDSAKQFIGRLAPKGRENSFPVKLTAGMASGMLGAAIANPFDLLKIRLQAPSATSKSIATHWREIVTASGYKGLYRAVWPTTIRAGILTSSQLASYDETKHIILGLKGFEEGFKTHLMASAVAGVVCSLASAPVDTVKVRLMNDSGHKYRNALHCTALLIKEEGPLSLYKGLAMCFGRLFPQSVISLLIFEQLRALCGIRPI